jgi:hypothetical protein
MPLPVIHAYAGYSIYKYSLTETDRKSWRMATLFILLANLADLDMLPGMFFGNAEMFHRGFTHSLAGSLVCALLVGGIAKVWKKASFSKFFLLSLAAYISHIMLDALTGYVNFAFWPFKITFNFINFAQLLQHANHPIIPCESLGQFCALLMSGTLAVRLAAEMLLVFTVSRISRLFPKYRVLQSGVSESPAFIAGLALFIFIVTAFVATNHAG